MKNLIGYCGLDCEKCNARIATIKDDDVLREKVAKQWSELNKITITKDMINCMGCRANGIKTPYCDYMCEIKKCASKNKYSTCKDCLKKDKCKILCQITSNSVEAIENLK